MLLCIKPCHLVMCLLCHAENLFKANYDKCSCRIGIEMYQCGFMRLSSLVTELKARFLDTGIALHELSSLSWPVMATEIETNQQRSLSNVDDKEAESARKSLLQVPCVLSFLMSLKLRTHVMSHMRLTTLPFPSNLPFHLFADLHAT